MNPLSFLPALPNLQPDPSAVTFNPPLPGLAMTDGERLLMQSIHAKKGARAMLRAARRLMQNKFDAARPRASKAFRGHAFRLGGFVG